ncbi:MAG: DEAD/DEAH box helicase [Phycisphaerae bacterium]|nr:DEAD/DEAH box helicase [Phycisphaerae bacterium]
MRVAEWLSDEGPLAQHLNAFEPRPQQREMAEAVAAAIAAPRHLAVEAGTGVGKTYAYLLPAIDHILRAKQRVVISTHTIALQEQLIHRDIPVLREALGVDFKAELVKGRNNYVSLRRLRGASHRQKTLFNSRHQLAVLHEIEDWAYETEDGSLSDLTEAPPLDIWEKVRSEHNNCLGRRCPLYEQCFYQRARRRAADAQLLVVNHALLVSDLVLRRDNASVLPDYAVVIVDEAHALDQVATDHLGASVANSQVHYVLSGLFNDRTGKGFLTGIGDDGHRQAVVRAAGACTEFFNSLSAWQAHRGRSNGRLIVAEPVQNVLSPALTEMCKKLGDLKKKLPREEDQYELQAVLDRASEAAQRVGDLLEQSFDEHVYWIDVEQARTRRVSLNGAPLNAGEALRTLLFDRVESVVLTSATLAIAGNDPFAYMLGRLGNPSAETLQLGSPFDYERQVTIHVEAGMPDPSAYSAFLPAAAAATIAHLRETEGRAFVLFTSYKHLNETAAIVRVELEPEGYTILAQGEKLPRSKMLDVFRETDRCVIFGTDSFWYGVDVIGEALSNVTIVKLPFAVPDRPTIEARMELMRSRGENPFNDFQLPEAILKFRQGFGRLIRSHSDHGIVVILDPRVTRKPYGRRFMDSLPKCHVEISQQPW